ncbi:MAG: 2-succinyl-5-enolpyruvyl-6-hydroxy-3-cyclohexene-1-carboxylate synthase [Acetatifactor sp.]|nr:2-succinyl-5-enolpyruvyl-6-hydroxy-3-cyclohexene-1-carboxylate synthase [Acetatifactor sp.]
MLHNYTSEKNILQLISLLKSHGIKKVVVSPGSSNVSFVASIQGDDYFEKYSVVDERSAAYVACGIAAEANEPVVICCTGATASRNYIPGLTEAYYRKLPIIAITALVHPGYVGQNRPQVMDRSVLPNDIALCSVQIESVCSEEDEWANNVKINKALIEARRNGGGPVHINMVTTFSRDFSIKELPKCRTIDLIHKSSDYPKVNGKRIAIFIGSHKKMDDKLTNVIDSFCEKFDAVVFKDHTSNYRGKYGIQANIISNQDYYVSDCLKMDILIDIGDVSGADMKLYPKEVWRVNPDGQIRDNRKKTRYVFAVEEQAFFDWYVSNEGQIKRSLAYYESCKKESEMLRNEISDFPFSNIWIAWKLSGILPAESVIHFAILNSLRSWNYFEYDKSICGYSNTGGFGIDGCVSSLIGASLVNPDKLYFGIIGDLAFFYDLNSLGIRHVGNNIRILLINNGNGTEFRNYSCIASQFEEDTCKFISAAEHFGNKSETFVKNIALSLGYEYYTAKNKEQVEKVLPIFTSKEGDKPIIFEVFTESEDESNALKIINNLQISSSQYVKSKAKKAIKKVLGDEKTNLVKSIIKNER